MDLLALVFGAIFFNFIHCGTPWDYIIRVILNSQETLRDAEGCGILGESTARSFAPAKGSNGCLSDCDWKVNPFYKTVDVHHSKLNERQRSSDNSFQYLYTSALVPTDLSCLSDCFAAYQYHPDDESQDELEKLRLNCSANGLDTLIPTSYKYGAEFIASNYSDMVLWYEVTNYEFTNNSKNFFQLASRDPRLDCFLYAYKILRTESEQVGNFIESGSVDGEAGSSDTATLFNTTNTDVSRFFFRASNTLQTAVEICVLAKRQSRLKAASIVFSDLDFEVEDIFGSTTPTCDHFLPDIFGPTSCRCVGTCASTIIGPSSGLPENHLDHFVAKEGLVGCHNACNKAEDCQFFTLSQRKINGTNLNLSICWLWRNCDSGFRIPDKSTSYKPEAGSWVISDHWSAPRDCNEQKETKCPTLICTETEYKVLFTYTMIPSLVDFAFSRCLHHKHSIINRDHHHGQQRQRKK